MDSDLIPFRQRVKLPIMFCQCVVPWLNDKAFVLVLDTANVDMVVFFENLMPRFAMTLQVVEISEAAIFAVGDVTRLDLWLWGLVTERLSITFDHGGEQ